MSKNKKIIISPIEKINKLKEYRYYNAFMNKMYRKGMDLSYPDEYVGTIEKAIYKIIEKDFIEIECNDTEMDPGRLEEIISNNFLPLFTGSSNFLFRIIMHNKTIDPSFPFAASDLETQKIILKSLDNGVDLETLLYEILHILIYKNNKQIVNLELFPQAFKLIVADYLDSIIPDAKYLASALSTQIEEFKYNNYLNLLFPSLTPVLLPYTMGSYLANEIYLAYKRDPNEFISLLNEILDGNVSIVEYLDLIGSPQKEENVDKVIENYQIVLK